MTTQPPQMTNQIGESKQLIIFIMLNDNDKVNVITAKSSPTRPSIPPTPFFSTKDLYDVSCPPIF